MKRTPHSLALLAVTALLAAPALPGEFNAVANLGDPLPAFADLPATDGSTLSSSELTEDAVVLVFLANHCPWVRGMDSDLVRLVDELAGESARVLGVSVNRRDEDRLPAMQQHAAKAGYNFTYLYDESQDLGRALGATRTPEYFVFDRDRKLAYMGAIHDSPARERSDGSIDYTNGDPRAFYVRDAVRAVLAGEPVPAAETKAHGCSVEYEG
ncbi:MAG: thioredoxin family protein [Thermoanaerobaculia bacterium]